MQAVLRRTVCIIELIQIGNSSLAGTICLAAGRKEYRPEETKVASDTGKGKVVPGPMMREHMSIFILLNIGVV